jgi:Sec-independent protein secretion pathway component TatC
LVSLLPPTDGVSLIVMSVPLVLIYEITIMANAFHKVPLARISSVDPITIS